MKRSNRGEREERDEREEKEEESNHRSDHREEAGLPHSEEAGLPHSEEARETPSSRRERASPRSTTAWSREQPGTPAQSSPPAKQPRVPRAEPRTEPRADSATVLYAGVVRRQLEAGRPPPRTVTQILRQSRQACTLQGPLLPRSWSRNPDQSQDTAQGGNRVHSRRGKAPAWKGVDSRVMCPYMVIMGQVWLQQAAGMMARAMLTGAAA